MGLFSFIGGLLGGGSQKKASDQAMNAQVAAYNRGIDLQNQQYQQTRSDYMPYTQAGTAAIGGLGDLVGINGNDKWQASIDSLKNSPIYQSLYHNGEEALLQNGAATGGLRGGNFARSSMDFGADVLSNVYQNQIGNYSNIAGLGLGATGSVAGYGAQNANNVSSLLGDIGKAQASNYLTKGGINAANWQNAGSFLDQAASFIPGGAGIGKALGSIF